MKIIDGIKLKGIAVEIPDCSRDDLPRFLVDKGFKVGAEVGVYKGEFTEKFCQVGLKMYAVDSWSWYEDYDHSQGQAHFDGIYDYAKKSLAAYSNSTIVRKTSMEAVKDFADESLDFVYIDGNHQLKYVIEDIFEWSKKVKKGGVISGHDYVNFNTRSQLGICHVIPAVNAYTQSYNITNWYLLGRKNTLPGEKRDKWRSWMFVKQ